MSEASQELSDELDLEYWAEREGLSYKNVRGHSGPQLNFKQCPCCGNSKSKVYLNADTGAGNCFRCGETFSKLKFIHHTLSKTWRETFLHVKEVLKEQGWKPKRTVSVAVENTAEVKLPLSVELPTEEGDTLAYLEKRGITGEYAKYFHLRYCDSGRWNYLKDDGTIGWQNFGKRVIIPVHDLDGELRTFQGRDIIGTSDRKYLFPVQLPGAGTFLYNGFNALATRHVLLNEGVFDVVASKIALDRYPVFRDVVPVGTFGKHLSYGRGDGNDQLGRFINLKSRGLEIVTIMWDGEHDALIAAVAAAELLQKIGLKVRIALLPQDKDPNEVIPEALIECFKAAQPYSAALAVRYRLRNPYHGVGSS